MRGSRILIMGRDRLDPLAGMAAVLALVMFVVYLVVIGLQEGERADWFVVALLVGAASSGYGAVLTAPYRRPFLMFAAVILMVMGFLAMFSIGLPIFIAGAFCLGAALRGSAVPKTGPTP